MPSEKMKAYQVGEGSESEHVMTFAKNIISLRDLSDTRFNAMRHRQHAQLCDVAEAHSLRRAESLQP